MGLVVEQRTMNVDPGFHLHLGQCVVNEQGTLSPHRTG